MGRISVTRCAACREYGEMSARILRERPEEVHATQDAVVAKLGYSGTYL
jgi:hypothetical protein